MTCRLAAVVQGAALLADDVVEMLLSLTVWQIQMLKLLAYKILTVIGK
jgi:hypothetical protein